MLTQANAAAHRLLDEYYLDLLEMLTACEYQAAWVAFQALHSALLAHLEFEEQHLLPLAEPYLDAAAHLVQADHRILQRLLDRLDVLLTSFVATEPSRREMLPELHSVIRLGAVLEHHDSREQTVFYPVLDERLSASLVSELALQLRSLIRDYRSAGTNLI